MKRIRYKIVDVFTDRPLNGNPLCVVLDECDPQLMPQIAREVNLPETTFPVVTGPDSYSMRIFTTQAEFPFAGHPSLGTAWALGAQRWTQTTSGAVVAIDATADGAWMSQPTPIFAEATNANVNEIAQTVGVTGISRAIYMTNGGLTFLAVLTNDPLERVTPNEQAFADLLRNTDAVGFAVANIENKHTVRVRAFFPGDAVFEDPGTGSLAGPLGVLAHAEYGVDQKLTVIQGEFVSRPCRIDVIASPNGVQIGGSVTLCAEGEFVL
jgi:trans-2,3-dihydro-3-hydroxyanthranilate isomerase